MGIKEFRLENLNNMKIEHQGIPHNVGISVGKAKEILKHGKVHGKPLTIKQKGFLGVKASGKKLNQRKGE